jgi:hypothetical protein
VTDLWLAQMPCVFGYGLMVFSTTAKKAEAMLKREYLDWRKGYLREGEADFYTYDEAMEWFGGSVEEIKLNHIYNDGVRE